MAPTVLIAAGGTGGHIFPGLAIAEELLAAGAAVVWLGAGGMETALVNKRGLPLHTVRTRPPRRWWHFALLLTAVWRACGVLVRVKPAAVLCMGGYAAVPAGLAAWLTRRPLLVHEQNAIPGKANKLLARFARRVLTGFPLRGARHQYVGNPVRAAFAAVPARMRAAPPRQLLVLGGSQGAAVLNEVVPAAAAQLAADGVQVQVVHQCGKGNGEAVRASYAQHNLSASATVEEFIDDVAGAMGAADVVVCRAGAATLAELAAAGTGAVLVPYPHAAADHQTANARHYAEQGAALLCPQPQFTPQYLAQTLQTADTPALAKAASSLAKPTAAADAAAHCLQEASYAA